MTRRKTSFSVPQYVSQNFLPFRRSGNLTETHPKAIDFAYALKPLKCIKPKYLAKPLPGKAGRKVFREGAGAERDNSVKQLEKKTGVHEIP